MRNKLLLVLGVLAFIIGLAVVSAGNYSDINEYSESIDYSCQVDNDCVIKDVRSCCGEYLKCTNEAAVVDADFVVSECAKTTAEGGGGGNCGFASINACVCQNNKCVGKRNMGSECKNLYWFDDNNKKCGQKQFCGEYMYGGLRAYESKIQCQKALNESCICTYDAKVCPDGSIVDRQCPDCKFSPCKNKYCDSEENEKCYKNLSNGRKAEIKIMPETASLRARERLGELGFNITLKEVGSGENAKAVYEVSGEKEGRMLGLFKIKGKVSVQVDAETGEVLKVGKPWWAFLASGI